jgi:tRNA(Arg) A34 adenosine deaminase TadA
MPIDDCVGEMATIDNCSNVLTDLHGLHKLSPSEALKAYSQLSLYTTAEPCPMVRPHLPRSGCLLILPQCASAIRWSGFAECIYGTSIETLMNRGFGQISIPSQEVFAESTKLPGETVLMADVLANETDPYFSWQFNHSYPCPKGCERGSGDNFCKLQVTDHEL